ncbi:MAG: ATP-binding protein, partial [Pseudomonadota bacterium]|nr:ATP-binding protein [Pseudomonadota bacterium]
REVLKTLQMSADSLLSLINDLLDISKIEARTVELEHVPFSLTRMMQEIISMLGVRVREKGLVFTCENNAVEGQMFMGDPTRLRQIVLNLCSNAIKFTEKGGVKVHIHCAATADPKRADVQIVVSDTGIGIAADSLDTIFHKFVQADASINRKYGGTGLGLAITKTLVEIMGGTLKADSTPGEGSSFRVEIPLEFADSADLQNFDGSLSAVVETSVTVEQKLKILLVEDYMPNVMVATTFLEYFGYLFDVATNGMEAIEKIKANTYAAALMDVQMHGMNGLEATKFIREYEKKEGRPRLPIIGMTAHALTGDRERCLGAGMDDYIAKPFNPTELEQKLRLITA